MNVAWSAPRPRQRPPDERALEHAALASPARLRILDLLVAAPGPLHTDDLAAAVGLHSSTLRGHLLVLADAGFVEQVVLRDGRPGRPTAGRDGLAAYTLPRGTIQSCAWPVTSAMRSKSAS